MSRKPSSRQIIEQQQAEIDRLRGALEAAELRYRPTSDAHEFLQTAYNNEELPFYMRLEAAKAAIKFERPTLAAVQVHQVDEAGLAARLEAARKRVNSVELLTYRREDTAA